MTTKNLWSPSQVRYLLRQCKSELVDSVSHSLQRAVGSTQVDVIGSTTVPTVEEAKLIHYEKPSLVLFKSCPSVSTRESCKEWLTLARKQTGWTNYVFGQDFIFPQKQPVVLLSPSPESFSYAQHAEMLAPKPPLICLEKKDDMSTVASFLNSRLFDDEDLNAEEAAAAAARSSSYLSSLAVGDGYAALWGPLKSKMHLIAVIGPEFHDATRIYAKAVETIQKHIVQDSDDDEQDKKSGNLEYTKCNDDKFVVYYKTALPSSADINLLESHKFYHLDSYPLAIFPLAVPGGQ